MLKNFKFFTFIDYVFIVLILILIGVQTYTQLLLPSYTADIIDVGIANQDLNFIYITGLLMLGISLISVVSSIISSYLASKTSIGLGTKLRDKIFNKVTNFSLQEYNNFGAATLITRNTNDIVQVQHFTFMMLRLMLRAPMMLIGGILMANREDSQLSFIFYYVLPILAAVILIIALIAVPLFKKMQIKLDNVNLVFRENLIGVRVIRAFNRFRREKLRFSKANKEHVDVAKKVNRLLSLINPLMGIIMNGTAVAIVYFGAIRVEEGMQVGSIFAFLQYAMQIMFSLVMVSMIFVMFPRAQASANRINEVLDTPLKIKDPEIKNNQVDKGVVKFNKVDFTYPNAEKPVLHNIDFEAKPGEIVAVIGGTGSGKSTLINLIPRFYDVSKGNITIDGTDIREFTQHELRNNIGFIPQTAQLFSGTIESNLKFGDKEASESQIKEAIEIAQASEFVYDSEEGIAKSVSQSGTNLSGGQKQRLSIARAIVRKPKIYIFDDSFSALDFKTDYELRKSLAPITKKSVVFIVAQRVSTIMNADKIIVLDKGEIVGLGTHEELLATNEVYKEIVSSQVTEEELQ